MNLLGLILVIMVGLAIVGFAFRVLTGIIRLFVTAVGIVILIAIVTYLLRIIS